MTREGSDRQWSFCYRNYEPLHLFSTFSPHFIEPWSTLILVCYYKRNFKIIPPFWNFLNYGDPCALENVRKTSPYFPLWPNVTSTSLSMYCSQENLQIHQILDMQWNICLSLQLTNDNYRVASWSQEQNPAEVMVIGWCFRIMGLFWFTL
jgi:hypothetical protein